MYFRHVEEQGYIEIRVTNRENTLSPKDIDINEIKDLIIKPIIKLQEKLKGKNKAKDICKYIYEFLLDIDIPNTIQIMIDKFKENNEIDLANQYAQVFYLLNYRY